ncbi:hypothetical protein CALCODRAFT_69615 [Calocera cornea HHB12733]|uniref:Uncharacterized protein n=1 Tax=Calocera cornea HHB12733 TaxID=1353952 RepID=A0A165DIU7_9BASI|nr:hypothetical protein CALCODRAFT_69615 [Calocera cornea HHB12733]
MLPLHIASGNNDFHQARPHTIDRLRCGIQHLWAWHSHANCCDSTHEDDIPYTHCLREDGSSLSAPEPYRTSQGVSAAACPRVRRWPESYRACIGTRKITSDPQIHSDQLAPLCRSQCSCLRPYTASIGISESLLEPVAVAALVPQTSPSRTALRKRRLRLLRPRGDWVPETEHRCVFCNARAPQLVQSDEGWIARLGIGVYTG